ncbi:APC family permease [Parafrigoribacterium mesophilum]|uniref:APC family permease n=1 Tax=Parafrigoribacterium mesophilum TaxID=433646 RepID=UPI003D15878C
MIGAGVFAAFAPAARAAGNGLLIGLVIAALVAFCNATSSAQLAAVYPVSGGTYVYGRRQLGPWWGFLAGWSFVIGKTASCAAMALTFAAYAAPAGWERPVAVAAVVALAAVNYRGVTRTALATRIIVTGVLITLAVVVASGVGAGLPVVGGILDGGLRDGGLVAHGWYGILQSAGLLFFAFAGYARIATMGEEVRAPSRTIPAAITIALAITVVIYAVIAVTVLGTLGPDAVAGSTAPLALTVQGSGWDWAVPLVRVGGAAASLGALLALIAGIGRTGLAMAREGDLPRWLAAVHPRFKVPHRAEVALAAVVGILVVGVDLRGAIGFSSFGVLLYYFVANVAAFSQRREQRRYPKALQVLGGTGCLVLVATVPLPAIGIGVVVLLVGILYRLITHAHPAT